MSQDPQISQTPSEWEQNIFAKVLLTTIEEQKRSRRWSIFFKLSFLIYIIFMTVMIFFRPNAEAIDYHLPHAAVVDINGTISAGEEASADNIIFSLREAFEAPNSKGIIMRINSPGGSPVQSSYIYNEVMRLKAKYPEKKVYSVIADVGGSGGYFIAAAADEIYANESSIVGSIGVLMMNFGFVDTMDKLGVEQRTLTSGENKQFLDPFSPMKEDHKEFANKLLKNIHGHFINAVKNGRGDRLKDDPTIYSGLFWTGDQALELGLIDGFGSASYVARELIGQDEMLEYSKPQNFLDKFAKKMGVTLKQNLKLQIDDLNAGVTIR